MKTDLEVEVEVDLRQLGKVLIFCDRHSPIIYRCVSISGEYIGDRSVKLRAHGK